PDLRGDEICRHRVALVLDMQALRESQTELVLFGPGRVSRIQSVDVDAPAKDDVARATVQMPQRALQPIWAGGTIGVGERQHTPPCVLDSSVARGVRARRGLVEQACLR